MEYFMTKRQPAESPATIAESQAMPTTNYYQKINKTEDIYIYIYIFVRASVAALRSEFASSFVGLLPFLATLLRNSVAPRIARCPDHRIPRTPDPQFESNFIARCVWHVAIWVLHVFAAFLNAALEACATSSVLPEISIPNLGDPPPPERQLVTAVSCGFMGLGKFSQRKEVLVRLDSEKFKGTWSNYKMNFVNSWNWIGVSQLLILWSIRWKIIEKIGESILMEEHMYW